VPTKHSLGYAPLNFTCLDVIFRRGKLQIVLYYVFLYTGADELICTMSNY